MTAAAIIATPTMAMADTSQMTAAIGVPTAGKSATAVIDVLYPYKSDGYDDFDSWFKDFNQRKSDCIQTIDDAVSSYGEYMSDDDSNRLAEIRTAYENALSIAAIDSYDDEVLSIIDGAESAYDDAVAAAAATKSNQSSSSSYSSGGGSYSGDYYQFMRDGVVNANGNKYTYYSESVLPGGGLSIPGRHTDGGFVKDGDGYICVANDKPNGTIVDTPWGAGKVYDSGTSGNHYDIYVE